MSLMTLLSAAVSLGASYAAMQRLGVTGALVGMLLGESISVLGVMALSRRQPERLPGVRLAAAGERVAAVAGSVGQPTDADRRRP
jgi:hypothetical protein